MIITSNKNKQTNNEQVHCLVLLLSVLDGLWFCVAAVREDRMPGGRNSGAVYNLYKVRMGVGHGVGVICVMSWEYPDKPEKETLTE